MNSNELKAEIVRKGFSVPEVAEAIGIKKSALYRKLKGTTQFKQKEIYALKITLGLSGDDINNIFFSA